MLTTYSLKKSFFMICKILGPFFNTLTSNVKSSLLNIDNLTQPIHIQLSKKQKTLFQFFSTFLKSTSSFKHSEIQDDSHRLCIAEIMDCEGYG